MKAADRGLKSGAGPPICYSVITQSNTNDDALIADLCAALLTPRDPEEMRRLLSDLCTPAEIHSLGERWHVARMLAETDLSYRDIHDATGVSTTTIVRVARFLRQEANLGYRRALEALGSRGDAR